MDAVSITPASISPSPTPLRVAIVDADRRVRQSLTALVPLAAGVEVVGTAGDAVSGVGLVETTRPDVLLLDPRLPEVDAGMALLFTVRSRWPTVRIVVMSSFASLEHPCLANGAFAFVPKCGSAHELITALLAPPR